MTLKEKLKETIIEELKQVNILLIEYYSRKNKDVINNLYHRGIIDDSSIEEALESAVFNQARRDYDLITAKGRSNPIYPDLIMGRPDCFVYALNKNKFSKREIKNIPFDYGENVETFNREFGRENLLSIIRDELINPKPLAKSREEYVDPHPVFF